MQFLLISRRDGESIPINPLQVSYVRRTGQVTSIYMADGQNFRIHAAVEAVIKAVAHAADAGASSKPITVEADEPAPLPGPGPQTPATPDAPATPAAAPPAADDGRTEEEEAELQTRAQRAAHDDGEGHKAKK